MENNKMIAEFMGLTLQECGGYLCSDSQEVIEVENLTYDSDWQMLMQVIEKIFNTDIYYSQYIEHNSSIFSDGKIEFSTKINNMYTQCVDFVKWYNLNIKPHE